MPNVTATAMAPQAAARAAVRLPGEIPGDFRAIVSPCVGAGRGPAHVGLSRRRGLVIPRANEGDPKKAEKVGPLVNEALRGPRSTDQLGRP